MSRSSIFKNGLYNSIGSAIQMLLSILIIPVLIRGVGLDEYGLWTLVASVFGLVELAEAGLSVSTTYFVSRDLADAAHSSISQTLTVTVGVSLLAARSSNDS
ncbi:MAG TPA: polysaccharide biosynthesis protein, partial [Anaerolineae bacterium]|nr:polysaccharide biosynthesis protein [Anaerolineae bacterium]